LIDHGDFLHVPENARDALAFLGSTGRYLQAEISQAGLPGEEYRPVVKPVGTGAAMAPIYPARRDIQVPIAL
jgi:hypothetical protein